MTAAEIQNLLVTLLAGAAGRGRGHWRRAIGAVAVHPMSTHPACNWSVAPSGAASDKVAIVKAVEIVRAEHPYVDP